MCRIRWPSSPACLNNCSERHLGTHLNRRFDCSAIAHRIYFDDAGPYRVSGSVDPTVCRGPAGLLQPYTHHHRFQRLCGASVKWLFELQGFQSIVSLQRKHQRITMSPHPLPNGSLPPSAPDPRPIFTVTFVWSPGVDKYPGSISDELSPAPEHLLLSVASTDTVNCVGSFVTKTCTLREAVVDYQLSLINNTVVLTIRT